MTGVYTYFIEEYSEDCKFTTWKMRWKNPNSQISYHIVLIATCDPCPDGDCGAGDYAGGFQFQLQDSNMNVLVDNICSTTSTSTSPFVTNPISGYYNIVYPNKNIKVYTPKGFPLPTISGKITEILYCKPPLKFKVVNLKYSESCTAPAPAPTPVPCKSKSGDKCTSCMVTDSSCVLKNGKCFQCPSGHRCTAIWDDSGKWVGDCSPTNNHCNLDRKNNITRTSKNYVKDVTCNCHIADNFGQWQCTSVYGGKQNCAYCDGSDNGCKCGYMDYVGTKDASCLNKNKQKMGNWMPCPAQPSSQNF